MIEIRQADDFKKWYDDLNKKIQGRISSRLERISKFGHFGDVKSLGEGLCELRWKNGWRIYFITLNKDCILLIIGGNKNEQEKNIKKARVFIRENRTH